MFSGGYYKYHTQYLDQIPIVFPKEEDKEKVISLVTNLRKLNKEINMLKGKKIDKTTDLSYKANRIENEIDEIVYKIYGITENERKLIEKKLDIKNIS